MLRLAKIAHDHSGGPSAASAEGAEGAVARFRERTSQAVDRTTIHRRGKLVIRRPPREGVRSTERVSGIELVALHADLTTPTLRAERLAGWARPRSRDEPTGNKGATS